MMSAFSRKNNKIPLQKIRLPNKRHVSNQWYPPGFGIGIYVKHTEEKCYK